MMTPDFSLKPGSSPLILSIPHSGRRLTPGLADRMTDAGRSLIDTDWWLERLYDLPLWREIDVTLLRADLSRYVIDLNRDPAGASLYPGQATTDLVPTTTFDGEPIYRPGQEPTAAEIGERTQRYFWPYHRALEGEISRLKATHGIVALWDCHSIRSRIPRLFDGTLPDLNLGTNSGASCDLELEYRLTHALAQDERHSHIVNGRFKGGWITRNYGRPANGIHAVQMEIACQAYMDEEPPFDYDEAKAGELQTILATLLRAVSGWVEDERPLWQHSPRNT